MARDEATQKLAEWIKQMGNHKVQVYHARGSKILGKEAEVIIDEANAYKRGKGESHEIGKGNIVY